MKKILLSLALVSGLSLNSVNMQAMEPNAQPTAQTQSWKEKFKKVLSLKKVSTGAMAAIGAFLIKKAVDTFNYAKDTENFYSANWASNDAWDKLETLCLKNSTPIYKEIDGLQILLSNEGFTSCVNANRGDFYNNTFAQIIQRTLNENAPYIIMAAVLLTTGVVCYLPLIKSLLQSISNKISKKTHDIEAGVEVKKAN